MRRSTATGGRGSGVVAYNVQTTVDTTHHLIVTHEVANVGTDRTRERGQGSEGDAETERLDVVAGRGYFNSAEILACNWAGITVTLPKPMTSEAKSEIGSSSETTEIAPTPPLS